MRQYGQRPDQHVPYLEFARSWFGSCEAHADLSRLGLRGKYIVYRTIIVHGAWLISICSVLLQIDLDNRLQYIQLDTSTALSVKEYWMSLMYSNSNGVWWWAKVFMNFVWCWFHLLFLIQSVVCQQKLAEYRLMLQGINMNREMHELLAGAVGNMAVGAAAHAA